MINKLDYIFAPFVLFFIFSDVIDGLTPLQLNKKYKKLIDSFWLKIQMVSLQILMIIIKSDVTLRSFSFSVII